MRAHLLKNVFELFHVKILLGNQTKNIDSYVIANLSNNERRGTIKSPWPIEKYFFHYSNCLKVWNAPFVLRYNLSFSLTKD